MLTGYTLLQQGLYYIRVWQYNGGYTMKKLQVVNYRGMELVTTGVETGILAGNTIQIVNSLQDACAIIDQWYTDLEV